MNHAELKRVGINPEKCFLAVLKGYRRVFSKRSRRRCAALTLAKRFESDSVWGIACIVDENAFKELERREVGYRVIDVGVEAYTCTGIMGCDAVTFIAEGDQLLGAEEYLSDCVDSAKGFNRLLNYLRILVSHKGIYYNIPYDLLICDLARALTPSGEPILCTLLYALAKQYEEIIVSGDVERRYLEPVKMFKECAGKSVSGDGDCWHQLARLVKKDYLAGWANIRAAHQIDDKALIEALEQLANKRPALRDDVDQGDLGEVRVMLRSLLKIKNIGITTATSLLHLALPEYLPPFSNSVCKLLFGENACSVLSNERFGHQVVEVYMMYIRLVQHIATMCKYSLNRLRQRLGNDEGEKSLVKLVDQALWLAQTLLDSLDKRQRASISIDEAETIHPLVRHLISCMA